MDDFELKEMFLGLNRTLAEPAETLAVHYALMVFAPGNGTICFYLQNGK